MRTGAAAQGRAVGAEVLIEWTPRLRQTIPRVEAMGRRNLHWVITGQEAQRYDYEAFKSTWARTIERSGVKGLHYHDLHAKALTDKEESHDMQEANCMSTHSTEGRTADYVHQRKAHKTEATR